MKPLYVPWPKISTESKALDRDHYDFDLFAHFWPPKRKDWQFEKSSRNLTRACPYFQPTDHIISLFCYRIRKLSALILRCKQWRRFPRKIQVFDSFTFPRNDFWRELYLFPSLQLKYYVKVQDFFQIASWYQKNSKLILPRFLTQKCDKVKQNIHFEKNSIYFC